jgi:hypothetical protein
MPRYLRRRAVGQRLCTLEARGVSVWRHARPPYPRGESRAQAPSSGAPSSVRPQIRGYGLGMRGIPVPRERSELEGPSRSCLLGVRDREPTALACSTVSPRIPSRCGRVGTTRSSVTEDKRRVIPYSGSWTLGNQTRHGHCLFSSSTAESRTPGERHSVV